MAWEVLHTFNPAATCLDDKVCLLYRAEDDSGVMKVGGHTSRIGLATSSDGIHFERESEPVLFPDHDDQHDREWTGGCEDPRLVARDDGTFVVTYTQYDGKGRARLAVATSRDLRHWTKHGPAFPDLSDVWSKSGAIVSRRVEDQLVATQIAGRFWMYWGEFEVRLAWSDDLRVWHNLEDPVLETRPGLFDSALVEVGPAAVLTDHGIVLFVNGKNSDGKNRDPRFGTGSYSAGQVLLDAKDPRQLIARPEMPYFWPQEPWEATGQYAAGTTFTEGLVPFNGKWWVYYGCADSFVGVATAPLV